MAADPTIKEIVSGRLVTAEFQPIARLDADEVVAYEAFARGPAGGSLRSPRAMFAAAEAHGLTAELDHVAHAAAYSAALAAHLPTSISLLVNSDARYLGSPVPDDLVGIVAQALARLRLLIEVSDRTLAAAPGPALAGIEKGRAAGWGIAWDGLGDTPDSLALMPFVRPDVVKIDVQSAHDGFAGHSGRVVNAAIAYAERTGASIMATGIESEAHVRTARGIGAQLGQGYFIGRPGPLPEGTRMPRQPVILHAGTETADARATPYDIVCAKRQPAHASLATLEAFADHLEQRAAIDPEPPVILTSLPPGQLQSAARRDVLERMAGNSSFMVAVTGDEPAFDAPGVRMVRLQPDDPLRDEWTLAVVGPHFAALLTARPDGPGDPYRYTYGLTYDRDLVTQAAQALLARVTEAAQPY